MHRKLVCFSILSIFFLIWGATGFTVGAARRDSLVQAGPPLQASTTLPVEATPPALIPVTGSPRLGWGTLLFYGLIGLAAMTLILALLDSANQSTGLYVRRRSPQDANAKE